MLNPDRHKYVTASNTLDKTALKRRVMASLGIEQDFTGNLATAHGQTYESIAIAKLCEVKKLDPFSLHTEDTFKTRDIFGATADGLIDGIPIEVKCPLTQSEKQILDDDHYYSQCLIQCYVYGSKFCYFAVYLSEIDKLVFEKRKFNEDFFNQYILPKAKQQQKEYLKITETTASAMDWLSASEGVLCDDEALNAKAKRLYELKTNQQAYAEEIKQLTEELKSSDWVKKNEKVSFGGYVKAKKTKRQLGLDIRKMTADGINVENYRKEGEVTGVTITI